MLRPRPVPRLGRFGGEERIEDPRQHWRGIPAPQSMNDSVTAPPTRCSRIVNDRCGAGSIASIAFQTMLTNTCFSWPASALTGSSSSPSCVTTVGAALLQTQPDQHQRLLGDLPEVADHELAGRRLRELQQLPENLRRFEDAVADRACTLLRARDCRAAAPRPASARRSRPPASACCSTRGRYRRPAFRAARLWPAAPPPLHHPALFRRASKRIGATCVAAAASIRTSCEPKVRGSTVWMTSTPCSSPRASTGTPRNE